MEIIHIDDEDIYNYIIENYGLNDGESEFFEDYGYIIKNLPDYDNFEVLIKIVNNNTYSLTIIDPLSEYNYNVIFDDFNDSLEEF